MPKIDGAKEFYVDVIAYDRDGNPVLLVEVKAHRMREDSDVDAEIRRLDSEPPGHPRRPFLMHVDLDRIVLYRPGGRSRPSRYGRQEAGRLEAIARFDAKEVFRHYDPEFGAKPINELYLTGLAEAWLRDLAYRWKSESPPGSDVLASVGLLDRLQDGTTVMEDVAGARPPVP